MVNFETVPLNLRKPTAQKTLLGPYLERKRHIKVKKIYII